MSKKETSWGNVSAWYDTLLETDTDSYQTQVVLPHMLRIVQPKQGMVISDIACGQGFFSRAFAEASATVIASDISPELINLARTKSTHVAYHISPAHDMSYISDGSVDVVTIVLALQNIQNIQDVFKEAYRVLKPSGRFVCVLNHPAFRIPEKTEWKYDEEKKKQYRAVYGYMSESRHDIMMHPGLSQSPTTISFHRPIQVYVKGLLNNGFVVTRFEEWISHKVSEKGPRKEAEDSARKEIPLFLCIEAEKRIQ